MQSEELGFAPLEINKLDFETSIVMPKTALKIIPTRIVVPSISLDAPIVPAVEKEVQKSGTTFLQWSAPDEFAAGWQTDSAYLGQPGNTVINGHHNINGLVFKDLNLVEVGEEISIYGSDQEQYTYEVANVMILPERDEPLDRQIENALWIMPSSDERLTVITCWPATSNTHRLIIVAKPIKKDTGFHSIEDIALMP